MSADKGEQQTCTTAAIQCAIPPWRGFVLWKLFRSLENATTSAVNKVDMSNVEKYHKMMIQVYEQMIHYWYNDTTILFSPCIYP